jgi:hypothetical protein
MVYIRRARNLTNRCRTDVVPQLKANYSSQQLHYCIHYRKGRSPGNIHRYSSSQPRAMKLIHSPIHSERHYIKLWINMAGFSSGKWLLVGEKIFCDEINGEITFKSEYIVILLNKKLRAISSKQFNMTIPEACLYTFRPLGTIIRSRSQHYEELVASSGETLTFSH